MASLKRKARRNYTTSKLRTSAIKRLSAKPVIKNIDIEEIKATFDKDAKPAAKKKAAPKKEAEVAAAPEAPAAEAPQAE